jgi:phosphoserine phosphatase RsbX
MIGGPTIPMLDWAFAGVALDGAESGDLHVVVPLPGGVLLAVIDGLGHGPEAAEAAREAAAILSLRAGAPLDELFKWCHEGLRKTRGVVMSLVAMDLQSSTIQWCGVGNVEGVLLPAVPGRAREAIHCRGGVVGCRLPPLKINTVRLAPRDLLLLATDGLRNEFASAVDLEQEPQRIADEILAREARGSDDALVLVARYLGAPA